MHLEENGLELRKKPRSTLCKVLEDLLYRERDRSALVSCDINDEVLISGPMLSCLSSTSPSFCSPSPCRALPRRLVADVLLGMLNIDLLLLYLRSKLGSSKSKENWSTRVAQFSISLDPRSSLVQQD
jgi:hypothetical protein